LLMAGWKIAYVADACVFHSHSYSWMQELRRYFDIGVMHNREKWMLEQFGGASGEGKRFVLSELNYLVRKDPARIPSALARTWLKFFGYRAGRLEKKISPRLKKHLSLNSNFWSAQMR
jgi:rhamnosyltransferase